MKLFAKIFICSMLILSVAVLFSGYLLITHSYQNAIDRETDRALAEYQYNKFTLQAGLIENADSLEGGISANDPVLSGIAAEMNGPAAFFSPEKALLYSNLPEKPEAFLLDGVTETNIVHRFYRTDGKIYLSVGGRLTQGQVSLYLLCAADISPIVLQKASMLRSFRAVYFITVAISTGFILILSAFLTRPIKKLTKAAARIADGHYEERLSVRGGDEIGILSGSFNRMAEAVEDKIHEPEEGQLTMEQAIQAGQSGLSFLAGRGIIPEGIADSGKIHAVLGEKKEDASRLLPDNPSLRSEEIRTPSELHPFYSYWIVSFSAEQADAVLTINAMTGQIWKAEFDSAGPAADASGEAAYEETKEAFLEYLDISANSLLFNISVKEGSYQTEEGVSRRTVSLSLTNRY